MHKSFAAIALAAGLQAVPAWAQPHRFAGWSFGVNANAASIWTEFIGGGTSAKLSDRAQNVSLQAAYGLTLGPRSVLGLGLSYGLGDLQAGSIDVDGHHVTFRLKEMYALYVEPGYALTHDWLVYAKLGHFGVRRGEESVDGVTASKTFGGWGYGLGLRTLLDRNLYLQLEFIQADYNRKTADFGSYRAMTTTTSLGLGFTF